MNSDDEIKRGSYAKEKGEVILRALDCAVPIRVCFDHRHYSRRWTDAIFYLSEVCGQVFEVYLRPRRAPRNLDSLVRKWWHGA